MTIAGVNISHPDKIIFPKANITKIDMVTYYEKVAPKMLPYLRDRPLTLHRFPNGVENPGFYQKNTADYFPDYIKTIEVPTQEGSNTEIYCNTKKSLIYLVNQGTVGFHIWLSQNDKLDKPDKIVFDLDPPDNSFEYVREAAQKVGDYLRAQGENPNLMTTGQHGLHVWYKIRRNKTFDEVRKETKATAENIEKQFPHLFTTQTLKKNREGKIFLDYLRNAYAQTSVCPYSLRPNDACGVATPVSWDELRKLDSARHYNFSNIMRRLGQLKSV